jgi:hypothetical protein
MTSLVKNYVHRKFDVPVERSLAVLNEWNTVHQEAFYDIDTSRERMSPALSKTRTYHLRRPVVPKGFIKKTTSAQNVLECEDTALYGTFPVMREFINWVGQEFYGGWTTLGRVFVTRLDAASNIGKHIDEGQYFETLHRHHFVLISQLAHFCWEDNIQVQLHRGELWAVNNSIPHWVTNSGMPRTHIIFDAA